ncbi:MAG TPA: hypothetical protein VGI18_14930 [Burkholderiales bacterium]
MSARLAALALTCALATDAAAQLPAIKPSTVDEWHGRLELKREDTARGTPGESTKTTVRVETFLDGPVNLLRIDLPFPDAKSDFEGDPFDPRMGDVKLRAGFRPLRRGDVLFPSFVEATFPTADPDEGGAGKYQLSAGIRMLAPLRYPFREGVKHKLLLEGEIAQTNSVGGDPARPSINYAKLELTLNDLWLDKYTFKLKVKPSFDHVRDDAGGVGEAEAGMYFGEGHRWRTWLMLGHRLWGPDGVAGTYENRVELGVNRTF